MLPPLQRTELHDYVKRLPYVLSALKDGTITPDVVKIVLCNETCDLDSTACAITFSFFLNQTKINASTIILPVLNTARQDFPLRPDCMALLCQYELDPEWLVFIDDVSFIRQTSLLFERLEVVLVDHNYPPDCCLWLVDKVVQVIDHHEKRPDPVPMKSCTKWLVEKVGSCSTLIAEEMLKFGGTRDEPSYHIDSTSAALLLAAILVDTVCGSPTAGRETPKDAEARTKLDETAQLPYNHGRFFEWLVSAKSDISRMSTADVLRKDAKLVVIGQKRIMMSSIPATLSSVLSRTDLAGSLEKVLTDTSSSAVVILCLSYANPNLPDDAKRELAIFSDDSDLLFSLANWFQSNKKVDLLLSPYVGFNSENVEHLLTANNNSHDDSGTTSPVSVNLIMGDRLIAFSQGNVRASRKQVLPLVEEFLQQRQ